MQQKQCFKCGVNKSLDEFYAHPAMGDGRLNKCKECTKRDVQINRRANLDYYRAYDRARGNRQTLEYRRRYIREQPHKYKAHYVVTNAVRNGTLDKAPCVICGATHRVHGHHDNYGRPLDVVWLCPAHHAERHKSMREGETLIRESKR